MATLLEQLRQQGPMGGAGMQTQQAQNLLSARSGKATAPGAAPRATNIQEQIQDQLTRGQLMDVAQQSAIQSAQQGQEQRAIEQQFAQQQAQLDEQSISQQETYQRQVEAALKDYSRNIKQLDVTRQGAKVEQLGFQLRLSNQSYITQLKSQAARDKILSETGFREALQRSVFADEMDLLSSDLDFRMLLKVDDAKFMKELASMDIDTAMAIASAEAKATNTQAIVGGLGKVIEAGATYAAREPSSKKTTAPSTTTSTAGLEVYPNVNWSPSTYGPQSE